MDWPALPHKARPQEQDRTVDQVNISTRRPNGAMPLGNGIPSSRKVGKRKKDQKRGEVETRHMRVEQYKVTISVIRPKNRLDKSPRGSMKRPISI